MDLRTVRVSAGLTVAKLSYEAKVDRKTIERAERGIPITDVKAALIANALTRITGSQHTVESLGINVSSYGRPE